MPSWLQYIIPAIFLLWMIFDTYLTIRLRKLALAWKKQAEIARHMVEEATEVTAALAAGRTGEDWFADVLQFHIKFGATINTHPTLLDPANTTLRVALGEEEAQELKDAIMAGSLPDIADALVDQIYIAIGTAVAYGIDLRPLWIAVHHANMRKVPFDVNLAAEQAAKGVKVPIGKILKPTGWKPADIADLLARQRMFVVNYEGFNKNRRYGVVTPMEAGFKIGQTVIANPFPPGNKL